MQYQKAFKTHWVEKIYDNSHKVAKPSKYNVETPTKNIGFEPYYGGNGTHLILFIAVGIYRANQKFYRAINRD
jgi:hypothetical protein